MRTVGQGQAAVLQERELRRRSSGLPGPRDLGRWENIPRTVTSLVERYPEVPEQSCLGGIRFAMERFAPRGFLFCAIFLRGPNKIWRESK